MLVIVPPSETKRPPPDRGRPVDLDALSFPELTDLRTEILEALIATSARSDAFARLHVKPSKAAEVARNTWIRELPTMPTLDVYSGPLHEGLECCVVLRGRSRTCRAKPRRHVLVVGPAPPRRLHPALPTAHLLAARRHGSAGADMADGAPRSSRRCRRFRGTRARPAFAQLPGDGRAQRARGSNRRPARGPGGRWGGRVGDVVAKRLRGQAARHVLETGADPREPNALAELLGDRWPTRLAEPQRPGTPWILTLVASD